MNSRRSLRGDLLLGGLLLCSLLASGTAFAGGWTQPPGGHYAKLGYRSVPGLPTDGGLGVGSEVVPLGDYTDGAFQLYGEYGVSQSWTAVVSATPLGHARYGEDSSLYTGPIRLGARRALTTGTTRTAVEILLGGTPPLGARDLAPEADVVWQGSVPTLAASGALQLGRGLRKGWVTAELGYRWNWGLSDVVIGGVQFGRQWEHLVLDLHLPWAWSLGTLEAPLNYMGTGDTQYIGLGIGAGWWFSEHVGVMTGFESVLFAQANAASLTLPIYLQLR